MKNAILFLTIISVSGCWFTQPANAEYRSGNSHYQAIHTKQMAHRNFTNRGRTKYIYTEHKSTLLGNPTAEIGAVQLQKNSRIRELNVAVDMKRNYRLSHSSFGKKKKISIGRISGGNKHLKKVNVVVNSDGRLHY